MDTNNRITRPFGYAIRFYRNRSGISSDRLAAIMDISRQTLSSWENGKTFPDAMQLKDLADIFKCKVDDFYNFHVRSGAYGANDVSEQASEERGGMVIKENLAREKNWLLNNPDNAINHMNEPGELTFTMLDLQRPGNRLVSNFNVPCVAKFLKQNNYKIIDYFIRGDFCYNEPATFTIEISSVSQLKHFKEDLSYLAWYLSYDNFFYSLPYGDMPDRISDEYRDTRINNIEALDRSAIGILFDASDEYYFVAVTCVDILPKDDPFYGCKAEYDKYKFKNKQDALDKIEQLEKDEAERMVESPGSKVRNYYHLGAVKDGEFFWSVEDDAPDGIL